MQSLLQQNLLHPLVDPERHNSYCINNSGIQEWQAAGILPRMCTMQLCCIPLGAVQEKIR